VFQKGVALTMEKIVGWMLSYFTAGYKTYKTLS
jgi:hypothetical protein